MEMVVFSSDKKESEEIKSMIYMLENGLQYLHLRKPHDEKEIENIIKQIPSEYHPNIVIHSSHQLIEKYALKGLHYPYKMIHSIHKKNTITQSRSFHSIDEIKENTFLFNYVFLSPVFKSISKNNYESPFSETELKTEIPSLRTHEKHMKIFALGGVSIDTLDKIKGYGFSGVGILGSLWGEENYDKRIHTFNLLYKKCRELN